MSTKIAEFIKSLVDRIEELEFKVKQLEDDLNEAKRYIDYSGDY